MAKRKRDGAYYRARLKRDYPRIYAELVAGKYPSVRAACIAAGLVAAPSGFLLLKRAWTKATSRDRREFLNWLKSGAPRKRSTAPSTPPSIVDTHGRLTPAATRFITDWIMRHRTTAGQILKQIGYKNFDWRLSYALKREFVLPHDIIVRLQDWLFRQGFR